MKKKFTKVDFAKWRSDAERDVGRLTLKNVVIQLLGQFNFDEADAIYHAQCADWWSSSEYVDAVSTAKNRHAKRLAEEDAAKRRGAILQGLPDRFDSDFLGSDLYFLDHCSEFITEKEFDFKKFLFVMKWIKKNTPDGKQLPDDEQIAAISAVHGNIQVVARAGSGKTTTLVNRALFLIRHCRVAPEEILILAFNRKAALDIRKKLLIMMDHAAEAAMKTEIDRRVKQAGEGRRASSYDIERSSVDAVAAGLNIALPHIMTFHALAHAIVHPENILHDEKDGGSLGLSRVIQDVIDDHLCDPAFRGKIRDLMLDHFREDWDRIVQGRHDQGKEDFLKYRRSLPR